MPRSDSGPIISGAVIGQWSPEPFSPEAVRSVSAFRSKEIEVAVPMRPMETIEDAAATQEQAEARLAAAQASGDEAAVARELALAEQVIAHARLTDLADMLSDLAGRVGRHGATTARSRTGGSATG